VTGMTSTPAAAGTRFGLAPARSAGPALLVACALIAALFFNGVFLQYLALAQIILLTAAAWLVLQSYAAGIAVPRGPLPFMLTLFVVWLAVSIAWSAAWYLSFLNLWWVGSIVLVFWMALLAPDAERWWRWLFGAVVGITSCLMVYALVQFLAWGEDAHATFLNRNSFAALLNLVSLPLAAALLAPPDKLDARRWLQTGGRWAGWAFVLTAMLIVALTKSRGAILSLVLGLTLLCVVVGRAHGWRRVAVLLGVFGAALIAANLQWHGIVLERLAGLDNPANAGATRFVIWKPAWDLLLQHPLRGIGLGTFWLAFPPFRSVGDTSAGFYVHNDYLQLWIETGLPGLLLWLGVLAAATQQFVRLLRAQVEPRDRVLATGAFGGLLAVGVHSLFTFNLYLLPIDLVAGVMLARVQALAVRSGMTKTFEWTPARRMTRRGFRTLVILIAAIPILHFASLTAGLRAVDQARADLDAGHLVMADRALNRAEILAPALDTTWYVHARMLVQSMRLLARAGKTEQRRTLYDLALEKLARAEALNPLRPQIYKERGDLYAENADLAGSDAVALAESQYREALKHDPRYLPARSALARLLAEHGRAKEAGSVLVRGLDYWQPYSRKIVHYIKQTAQTLSAAGDMKTRSEILRRYGGWLSYAGRPASSNGSAGEPTKNHAPTGHER